MGFAVAAQRQPSGCPTIARMKVLNLQCQHAHSFEGWFASEQDFQDQLARGLVECPLCADKAVQKMPSAPRLNLSTSREVAVAQPAKQDVVSAPVPTEQQHMQAAYLKMMRHMLANTEDVGERFASEARSMHDGATPERPIRGQATREEALELLEEGISVLPLSIPAALKEPLQ
jgi:hypothetical protein